MHVASTIARLLRQLADDESVSLARIAANARVPLDEVEACLSGGTRLTPEKQMRIAAAIVTVAPSYRRAAHSLYSQAQAELRFAMREVVSHTSYPGSRMDASNASNRPVRGSVLEDAWRESAAAVARSRELQDASARLLAEASRLVVEKRALSAMTVEALRRDVEGLARVLRQSGAPPERALVLVKSAVQPLVAASPLDADGVFHQIVHWFVESYYAA